MTTVADQVVIPQADLAPPPAAVPTPAPQLATTANPGAEVSAEIAYLRAHGLETEATSLQGELEALLRTQPSATPAPAPVAPQPVPNPEAAQTAQERALDPYAPDAPRTETDHGEEDFNSVVIDSEGRARDAATGKYVPLKALQSERQQAKELRAELAKQREQQARVEERLSILQEIIDAPDATAVAPSPEPAAEEEMVDPEVDIFKSAKQMQAYIKKLEAKLAGNEQLTQAQLGELTMQQKIRSDVTSFNARQQDFFPAYQHLRTVRDAALQALGFTDKAAREAQLSREERGLANQAVKENRSYGETLYNLAKAYGYAGPAPAPAPAPALQPAPQPAPAPLAPVVDPVAAAQVQALAAAKAQASPTLNGQGGTPSEGITVSRLASMSETEFLDLAAKLGGKSKMDSYFRGI